MKRVKLRLGTSAIVKLMTGEPVAVKLPIGASILELQSDLPQRSSESRGSLAELLDVFFNGRPARKV